MNAPDIIPPIIGTPMDGGFFAGRFALDDGTHYALIVAPKAAGEVIARAWIDDYKAVPGAHSYNDGMANTVAMAAAGSELAQWSRGLQIAGFADWYLPSQDELELLYRAFKPTAPANTCWARSGINLSALPPTRPYTPDFPVQTSDSGFSEGGIEAFSDNWYWSSTQHAANSDYAWFQGFDDGFQGYEGTDDKLRARAVRRSII